MRRRRTPEKSVALQACVERLPVSLVVLPDPVCVSRKATPLDRRIERRAKPALAALLSMRATCCADARSVRQLRTECKAKYKIAAAQTVATTTMVPVVRLSIGPSRDKRSGMGPFSQLVLPAEQVSCCLVA